MENNYSFYATLTVNLFIDDNDFDFICNSCKHHYDRTVKSLQEIGGFLFGAKVRRTPYADWLPKDEDRIVEFNANQLGLIMKSFEMLSGEQASRLNLMFHKIASEMAIKQKFINENMSSYRVEIKYVDLRKTN